MRFNGIRKFVERMFPGCARNRRGHVKRRASRAVANRFETCEERVLLTVDMNLVHSTNQYASNPKNPVDMATDGAGHWYFAGYDAGHGQEIWTSDGTAAGTHLLKDVVPGPGSSNAKLLGMIGNWAYFGAIDSPRGGQIWKTDGTTTVRVTDLDGSDFTNPIYRQTAGNKLYFEGHDGLNGWEMWVTDGTAAGTHVVADIDPGNVSANNTQLTDVNGRLYFVGTNTTGGTWQLYTVDPVTDQLTLLMPLEQTSSWGNPPFNALMNVNGQLYFCVNDGVHGKELWTTDGTVAGTRMVKDINPSGDGFKTPYTAFGSSMVFLANDGTNGDELWISDGTDAGTKPLTNLTPASPIDGSYFKNVVSVNGKLVFGADDGVNGKELWVSDGTPGGTNLLKEITSGATGTTFGFFTVAGNTAYFTANGDLWKTDGTVAGTGLVKTFASANPSGSISGAFWSTVGNKAVFSATVNGVASYWVSDGTEAGTFSLEGQPPAAPVSSGKFLFAKPETTGGKIDLWGSHLTTGAAVNLGAVSQSQLSVTDLSAHLTVGNLFFYTNGNTLGVTDGTATGDKTLMTFSAAPVFRGSANGFVYFNANDGVNGVELWRSDGTVAGTKIVKDINPGAGSSSASAVWAKAGGMILFSADDGVHGAELWQSDGTDAGTVLLKDINPGVATSSITYLKTMPDGTVYFTANDGTHGTELWVSNGTTAGTLLLNDIVSGAGGTTITALSTNATGLFYFLAADAAHGAELWVSNGTAVGTSLVKDINPGMGNSSVKILSSTADGRVYFTANNGVYSNLLWVTDGTSAGTKFIPDATPGSIGGFVPAGTAIVGGAFYFMLNNHGGNACELWKYDPVTDSATLVKGFLPGGVSTSYLVGLNNKMIVYVDDNTNISLWGSDGTDAGTAFLLSTPIVEYGNFEDGISAFGGLAYFTTYEPGNGKGMRLWRSDGTVGGTFVLQEFGMDEQSFPAKFFVEQGIVYFWQYGKANVEWLDLWRTDGTVAGTAIVKGSFVDPGPGFSLSISNVEHNNSGTMYVQIKDKYNTVRWWSLRLVPESVGVYRNGTFYLDGDGSNGWKVTGNAVTDRSFAFGIAGDVPVSGDWNADNAKEIGVFRNGVWFLDQNGNYKWNGVAGGDVTFNFGTSGDVPVTGDWNGDGITDVGVFRNGAFYLDLNGNHKWDSSVDAYFKFGNPGDKPVTGDWNGDGKTDVGVFRGATWYLDQDGSRKWSAGDVSFNFGTAGDSPVTGDWNADGKTDVGVYRSGFYYIDKDGNRKWTASDVKFGFGSAGDVPVMAGTWNLGAPSVKTSSTSPASLSVPVSAVETPAVVVKALESAVVEGAVSPEVTKVKKHAMKHGHKGQS